MPDQLRLWPEDHEDGLRWSVSRDKRLQQCAQPLESAIGLVFENPAIEITDEPMGTGTGEIRLAISRKRSKSLEFRGGRSPRRPVQVGPRDEVIVHRLCVIELRLAKRVLRIGDLQL